MAKKIISIIYMIITLLFIGLLFKIDILPSNILFPIILISIGTSILNIFLLLKFKNTILNSIILFIMFIISIFYIFGIYQLGTTISFITSINNIKDIENKYYVLVKKDREFCIKNMALFKRYADTNIDMNYMYWFFYFVQYSLKAEASGGVQSFISLTRFREYPFPLPPYEE